MTAVLAPPVEDHLDRGGRAVHDVTGTCPTTATARLLEAVGPYCCGMCLPVRENFRKAPTVNGVLIGRNVGLARK